MADIQGVKRKIAQADEIADIPIVDEAGEPYLGADGKPSTIGVLGQDSQTFKRALEDHSRRVAKLSRAEQHKVDWRRATAVCAVQRWSGWEDGTTPLPPTPENVDALLRALHILEQVEAGVKGHAGFFGTRSPS